MLRFFRTIRKSFFESNQMKKYSLYAIGEILLVVIGILVALQINNWNERRKVQEVANTYKAKLINDLIQDTINLNTLIEKSSFWAKKIDNYFVFIAQNESSLQEKVDSSLNVEWNYRRYFPINYTFSEMQSSGKLSLLSEEQRRSLIELSNQQEFFQIIIDRTISDSKNAMYETRKYWASNYRNSWTEANVPDLQLIPDDLLKGLHHHHNFLYDVYNMYDVITEMGERIKGLSSKTIEYLKEDKSH